MTGAQAGNDLLIRVDTLDQLFNAPPANPFSDKPAVVLGEVALLHAVRQGLGHGLRDWQGRRLIIQLPPDQISADLQPRVVEAVRRYAAEKRAENQVLIRLSRWRSLVGLVMAITIATTLLAIVLILTSTLLAASSDVVKGILAGIVTIFIWATVWNPWDRLVYEWVGPSLENRILHNITTMEIVIRAEPPSVERSGSPS
jgi:hypothetical protein